MKCKTLIVSTEFAICAAVIVLTLTPMFLLPLNAAQPDPKGCVAVTKDEYDSAKTENLLRTRYTAYLITGGLFNRHYWYCN
jgi:hypothetical protein